MIGPTCESFPCPARVLLGYTDRPICVTLYIELNINSFRLVGFTCQVAIFFLL
eukprot:TRINITY_DN52_c0_g3_i3.p3 TRINITY_DN52_c0_g3~~TRINITY_DN52_c0_g3_i3.p3  ORF type:complete len:53 (+),score=1.30 TRINITY_DN52_c0_g3_i3:266-424(+)